jgi:choice-of-anchor B domain-containing protein
MALALPVQAQSFGNAVLVNGDDVLVGEPAHEMRSGLIWVFRQGASGEWEQVQRLEPSDGSAADRFGIRMAAQGDELFVSATRTDNGTGAIYTFRRTGGEWTETGRLGVMGGSPADSLGSGLSVDGDWLAVGSIAHVDGQGAIWMFQRDGDSWAEHSKLEIPGVATEERAGGQLALYGDWLLAGIPARGEGAGAVQVYRYDAATDAWMAHSTLSSDGIEGSVAFGASIAVADGVALVGAPGFMGQSGAVLTYSLEADSWRRGSMLTPFEAYPRGGFGQDIAFDGVDAWIGAPTAARFTGRVYAYSRDPGTGEWTGGSKLRIDELNPGGFFAVTTALSGGVAVASALGDDYGAGAAYVFSRSDSGWAGGSKITPEVVGMEAIAGEEVTCSDSGQAALFTCQEVDLLSFTPLAAMGAERGVKTNDVWGWTDPETGQEIAIVGMTDQTAFLDVTNPSLPVFLGKLPMTPGANGADWRDMKVYDDHVFIVADGSGPHGMQGFDLTRLRGLDGSDPQTFEMDALYDAVASAHNIVINETTGYGYIVGANGGGQTCGGGLHMINLQDPLNPTFVGCFQDTSTGRQRTGYSHDAQCVNYHGPDEDYVGREICFGSNETALSIADVTDKENPVAVSMASYPNVAYSHQGWVDEGHEYFYMNDELDETGGNVASTRTLVWDIRDLDDPVLVNEYMADNRSSDHNLYVLGDVMYQSNYESGLRILDISDRENPELVGYFDTMPWGDDSPGFEGSWSNYPYFASGIVIVTSIREGLFVVRFRGQAPVS